MECVPAARFMDVDAACLKSVTLPFAEIVSLPEQGIWALMVREPDPNIAARSFVTHVGLRAGKDEGVELGVCIDIVDRDPSLPEQDRAYRPQFIRLLFETKDMTLTQAEPLAFRRYAEVADRRGVARLKDLADSEKNMLPLVIFTHAVRKQPKMDEIERIMDDVMKPALPLGSLSLPSFDVIPVLPKEERAKPFLPYDAEEFAKHIYGFARVYVVKPDAFKELRSRFNRARFSEGDILVVEPKPFGGAVRAILFNEGLEETWYEGVLAELKASLERYSKHKPYSYGGVLFVDDARQRMREREIEGLRASIHREMSGELQSAMELLEKERAESAEHIRRINELKAQMLNEYERGAASERQRADQLEAQAARVRAENALLKSSNEAMRRAFEEFSAMREIARRVQSVDKMPVTNADVVDYFRLIYQDRIDFTDRGRKTAARCDINPEALWTCLYHAACELVDLHRSGVQNIEKAFKEKTGWEVAMSEGSMTRKVSDYMNLRRDTYRGREISVEPHIKFSRSVQKTGAHHQRLYYAYDSETGKLIVGCVGDHLENYSSLGLH